jgi:hypothetical protein
MVVQGQLAVTWRQTMTTAADYRRGMQMVAKRTALILASVLAQAGPGLNLAWRKWTCCCPACVPDWSGHRAT